MSNKNSSEAFNKSIHNLGRWSNSVAVILMFCVPLFTMLIYKVEVDWPTTFKAAMQLCIVFIPTQLTEVISFTPIIGAGGTYLSFITGNVMNMKVPAATAGHRLMNVVPHSEEGEVVSILAIGMSSITTTLIIFVGMFALTPLMPLLSSEVLKPGFNNIMPALMGAMLLPHLVKNRKYVVVPIILATIAGVVVAKYGMVQGYLLIGIMIASVVTAILLTKNEGK